jgi:hypothetical protein
MTTKSSINIARSTLHPSVIADLIRNPMLEQTMNPIGIADQVRNDEIIIYQLITEP